MTSFTTLLRPQQFEAGEQAQVLGEEVSLTNRPASALTTDLHMFLAFTYTATLQKLNFITCFREEYMPKQYSPFGKSQSCQNAAFIPLANHVMKFNKGLASVLCDSLWVHSPPGTACHEILKPLPFMRLSV